MISYGLGTKHFLQLFEKICHQVRNYRASEGSRDRQVVIFRITYAEYITKYTTKLNSVIFFVLQSDVVCDSESDDDKL